MVRSAKVIALPLERSATGRPSLSEALAPHMPPDPIWLPKPVALEPGALGFAMRLATDTLEPGEADAVARLAAAGAAVDQARADHGEDGPEMLAALMDADLQRRIDYEVYRRMEGARILSDTVNRLSGLGAELLRASAVTGFEAAHSRLTPQAQQAPMGGHFLPVALRPSQPCALHLPLPCARHRLAATIAQADAPRNMPWMLRPSTLELDATLHNAVIARPRGMLRTLIKTGMLRPTGVAASRGRDGSPPARAPALPTRAVFLSDVTLRLRLPAADAARLDELVMRAGSAGLSILGLSGLKRLRLPPDRGDVVTRLLRAPGVHLTGLICRDPRCC